MQNELQIDYEAYLKIRKRKEFKRRQQNLPLPSMEENMKRFISEILHPILDNAYDSLSIDDREIFQSVIVDGKMTVKDIATRRGVARSTIYRRITRICKQLQQFLKYHPIVIEVLDFYQDA